MAAITPITGDAKKGPYCKELRVLTISGQMLRRRLVLDLGIGFGLGFAMANWYWYGFHMPRTNARDNFYTKLEAKRAEENKE